MRGAAVVAGIGFVAMAVALIYGFVRGDGWDEVATLTASPWFNVSLVDVYVGFALFGGWIVHRERRPIAAGGWIVALLLLGNLVACAYVLLALRSSGGDALRFWHGSTESLRPA